ncbi:MAG: hypothetical protein ACK46X_18895 [Candidatus Sericytochromatia bacterium]
MGRALMAGVLLASLTSLGCLPTAIDIPIGVTASPTPAPVSSTSEGLIVTPAFSKLNIDGTLFGMADMSGDAEIQSADQDIVPEFGLQGLGFHVQNARTGPRKAVVNGAITLKGYDWKIVPLMPTKATKAGGKFRFLNVPSKVAFFLDATYMVDGMTYRSFGLVRTSNGTEESVVEIDVASTLVSRYLLRLMHYSQQRVKDPAVPGDVPLNKPVDFKDLDPRDFNPLLQDLRDILGPGLPVGMSLDLSKVTQPSGEWTLAKDKADPAVVLLDQLAGYPQINFDMQRLADAVGKPYNIKKMRPPSAAN